MPAAELRRIISCSVVKHECALQQSWLLARAALSSTVFSDFFCLPALMFASSLLNSVSTAVAGSASSMPTESGARTRVHLGSVQQSGLKVLVCSQHLRPARLDVPSAPSAGGLLNAYIGSLKEVLRLNGILWWTDKQAAGSSAFGKVPTARST